MIEQIKYWIGRYSVAIVAILAGLLIISVIGNIVWLNDNAELLTMGLIKLGVWLAAFLLITKFGFPKLTIQDTIKDDPKAVSILVAGIAVAIALIL